MLNSKYEWRSNRIPRQVIAEEDEDPHPQPEAAKPQTGQKRGATVGVEFSQEDRNPPNANKDDAFHDQYVQRRERMRITKRIAKEKSEDQEKEDLKCGRKVASSPSNDEEGMAKLVNLQSKPGGSNRLEWRTRKARGDKPSFKQNRF